jgi:hypothetical protein
MKPFANAMVDTATAKGTAMERIERSVKKAKD